MKNRNKGFTLVELVIIIAILAILIGVLAPTYTKYKKKAGNQLILQMSGRRMTKW